MFNSPQLVSETRRSGSDRERKRGGYSARGTAALAVGGGDRAADMIAVIATPLRIWATWAGRYRVIAGRRRRLRAWITLGEGGRGAVPGVMGSAAAIEGLANLGGAISGGRGAATAFRARASSGAGGLG